MWGWQQRGSQLFRHSSGRNSEEAQIMEVQKYCVYNQTRESFLSLGVTVADPTLAQVRELIDKVGARPDSGLWMVPYRGSLPARGHSPVDLLYLDNDYRVIQEVESFLPSSLESLKDDGA